MPLASSQISSALDMDPSAKFFLKYQSKEHIL